MVRKYRQFYYINVFLCWIIGISFISNNAQAQKKHVVVYSGLNDFEVPTLNLVDSTSIEKVANKIVHDLRLKGFWLSEVRSTVWNNDTLYLDFFTGRKFKSLDIEYDIQDTLSTTFRQRRKWKKQQTIDQLDYSIEQFLTTHENNGYPFATIVIDSSSLDGDLLFLKLKTNSGIAITYDSLHISPNGLLKEQFLSKYLGIGFDKPYSEKIVSEIPERLSNLPFVELRDVNISYQLKRAEVYIDLSRRKTNRFDGILGMIPAREGSGVEFTGELNLAVTNLFRSAKALEIHWQKLKPESQKLNASYLHPMLFGSSLDLNVSYDQIKQDTTFSNRSLHLAFEYYANPRLKMRVRYENKLGNQLETSSIESADFSIDYYGIGALYSNLDDKVNPRNGFSFELNAGLGAKEVNSLASIIPRSTQYDFNSNLSFYKSVFTRSVISFSSAAGYLINDYLFINDLYRLGGLNSIRGFDEGEFFAAEYLQTKVEWRFHLDKSSYLVAFYDQAFMSYDIKTSRFADKPSGIGIGMQITTEGGDFLILYGLGRREGEQFSFDSSKIHFGYSALF